VALTGLELDYLAGQNNLVAVTKTLNCPNQRGGKLLARPLSDLSILIGGVSVTQRLFQPNGTIQQDDETVPLPVSYTLPSV
jgi:hypothetical protein